MDPLFVPFSLSPYSLNQETKADALSPIKLAVSECQADISANENMLIRETESIRDESLRLQFQSQIRRMSKILQKTLLLMQSTGSSASDIRNYTNRSLADLDFTRKRVHENTENYHLKQAQLHEKLSFIGNNIQGTSLEPYNYMHSENQSLEHAALKIAPLTQILQEKLNQDSFFALQAPARPKVDTSVIASAQHFMRERAMQQIVTAEMGAAAIKGFDAALSFTVESICSANNVNQKVCSVAADLGKKVGKKVVEISKAAITAVGAKPFVKKILSVEGVALPQHLIKLGVPRNMAEQYGEDSLKLALASVACVSVSPLVRVGIKQVVRPLKAIKSRYLPATYGEVRFSGSQFECKFSHIKRADGSMTVFIDYLNATNRVGYSSGSVFKTISKIKEFAREKGATGLYVQWYVGNERLLNLVEKSKGFQYLGEKPHPAPKLTILPARITGSMMPIFKVLDF